MDYHEVETITWQSHTEEDRMKQFNLDQMRVENSVLETIKVKEFNREYGAYIGLDVHKDNISIGVAYSGPC